ncbi:MAG: methyltransferase domain-containing protein [Saprospiraceae bacterium]|nr:methyltransferase domain-containing protein [Saprospiraceae bacterium]
MSVKHLRTTGAVARSSKYLVREMLKPVDFKNAKFIVELGAGDGVFTLELLKKMRPDALLLCFEINEKFCEILRGCIDDKRFILIEDSAENLTDYLKQYDIEEVDYVVSAIPFVSLPKDLANGIIKICHKALKKNGLYIQFHYTTMIKKIYRRIFGNVDISFVPLNMPPAFVMRCEKR